MPLYEITTTGAMFGQQIINRYNYHASSGGGGTATALGLAHAFGFIPDTVGGVDFPVDSVIHKQLAVQAAAYQLVQGTVINVYDPTDFFNTGFPAGAHGAFNEAAESPTICFGFYTDVVRRDIKRGKKRIAGVPSGHLNSGGVINADTITALMALAGGFGEVLTYDAGSGAASFAPIVVSKLKYDPNPTNATRNHVAYKYYSTEAAQLAKSFVVPTTGWHVYPDVRTQTSRQYGKGA